MKKLSDFSKSERVITVVFIFCSVIWILFLLVSVLILGGGGVGDVFQLKFLLVGFVPIGLMAGLTVGLMIGVKWIRSSSKNSE